MYDRLGRILLVDSSGKVVARYAEDAEVFMLGLRGHLNGYFRGAHIKILEEIVETAVSQDCSSKILTARTWEKGHLPERHYYGNVWITVKFSPRPPHFLIVRTGAALHS